MRAKGTGFLHSGKIDRATIYRRIVTTGVREDLAVRLHFSAASPSSTPAWRVLSLPRTLRVDFTASRATGSHRVLRLTGVQAPMGPPALSVSRLELLTDRLAPSEPIHNRIWLNTTTVPNIFVLDRDTTSNDVSDNDAAGWIDLGDLERGRAAPVDFESTAVDNILAGSTLEGYAMCPATG
jgi:hypothetical protein